MSSVVVGRGGPEIYVFINGEVDQRFGGGITVTALSQDGEFLTGHLCTNVGFAYHDMGLTSDWKHDKYRERYGDNYTVIWCDDPDDPRIQVAYAKHVEAGEAGTPWQQQRKART